MENAIKEQLDLFCDRTSASVLPANRLLESCSAASSLRAPSRSTGSSGRVRRSPREARRSVRAAAIPARRQSPAGHTRPRERRPAAGSRPGLRSDHAVLGQVTPKRIDRLRALPHQEVARAKEHPLRLLRLALDRHEVHGRSLCRFRDRLRVSHRPVHPRPVHLKVPVSQVDPEDGNLFHVDASSLRWSTIAPYHLGTSRCRREGASTPSELGPSTSVTSMEPTGFEPVTSYLQSAYERLSITARNHPSSTRTARSAALADQ